MVVSLGRKAEGRGQKDGVTLMIGGVHQSSRTAFYLPPAEAIAIDSDRCPDAAFDQP